ncbi:FtsX-like permease family protein [uncultured Clostridium sp.]|uniref:FtsX-like permease family protein n=1 Tax=uncultured Clostridium sp. TaxID=59620 RepID=UPI0026231EBC|nr:FtsX-like permease family protein [uncultured Clostridium sp.]
MISGNNNGLKKLSSKIFTYNKSKNIITILAISLTTILLTIVSVVGINVIRANEAYTIATQRFGSMNIGTVFAIIFCILLVSVSGYLIVYNIFYISVIKDIRVYGQLKIVGMTFKQIKKLIYNWAMKLLAIAVPIGFVIGGIIGTILTTILFRETALEEYIKAEFSMIPYLGALIFTYITVLISINKPSKIAGKISGVEALNYNSNDLRVANKKKTKRNKKVIIKKRKKGAKLKNMALYNILKNKTKVIISVLSISISSILVVLTIIMGVGLDVEAHAARYNMRDNRIDIDRHSGNELNEDIFEKIKDIGGIEIFDTTIGFRGVNPFGSSESINIKATPELLKEFEYYKRGYYINIDEDYGISMSVKGINRKNLKQNTDRFRLVGGRVDEEKFKSGKYIIINRAENKIENGIEAGDIVELEMTIKDKNNNLKTIKEKFEVMAIVEEMDSNGLVSNLGTITMEENRLIELFGKENVVISSMDIDIEDEKEKLVEKQIEEIIKGSGYSQSSKNHYIDGVSSLKSSILFGTGLASIIFGTMAILNILNSTLSDLLVRKREFAMLEAIGMTKKEQKKLLRYEGMYILGLTAIFIIPLGLIATFLAPIMVPIYGGVNFPAYIATIIFILFIIGIFVVYIPSFVLSKISKDESIVERIKED